MINAYKGYYLNVEWFGAIEIVGNRNNTNILDVEWRSFHSLSKSNPAHLLAFWVLETSIENGALPYTILPATAYDQRRRSSCGYTQGRFRGESMLYAEAEHRFQRVAEVC